MFNGDIANILLPCIFRNFYPRNTAKYEPQIEFMTKHCMFSLQVYPIPEYFTQPLGAMGVTFCMSAERVSRGRSVAVGVSDSWKGPYDM